MSTLTFNSNEILLNNKNIPQAISVTYSTLVSLRSNSNLVPGQFYRITDYQTTTTQKNTQSAGHQFDIIVTADSESVLNENAKAVRRIGNIYRVYKTNIDGYPDEIDMDDYYKYVSPFTYEGTEYYMWRKYEYGGETDYYILTDRLYEDGELSLSNPIQVQYFLRIEGGEVTYNSIGRQDVDYLVKSVVTQQIYDDYFYGCKLESWELKYSLDNDTTRFAWADETNGKGVIYYMKDEWNNECPYDFKNIQFKRDLANIGGLSESEDVWCYTFSCFDDGFSSGATCVDESVVAKDHIESDEEGQFGNNIIKENTVVGTLTLNDIVFYTDWSVELVNHYSNTFDKNCYSNTFDKNCYSNTFGSNCFSNTFSKNYTSYCIVENGNQYITLTTSQTTSLEAPLRNITIAQGCNNTPINKTITHPTVDDTFQTIYRPSNSTVVDV